MGRPALSGAHGPLLSAVEGRVLASTTSHKREPLLPVLEVFGRLGLHDLDLNLHHLLEVGVPVDAVAESVAAEWPPAVDPLRRLVRLLPPRARDRADVRVGRSAGGARRCARRVLAAAVLRTAAYAEYSRAAADTAAANLMRLSDRHPAMHFVFENHDGASLHPDVCREILDRTSRPNLQMNFDPINFAKAGVDPAAALAGLQPVIGHVHLKGLDGGEYCEFGEGDVDLRPCLESLLSGGYAGRFTVEYEGRFDGTLRLYRSVQRAQREIGMLLTEPGPKSFAT